MRPSTSVVSTLSASESSASQALPWLREADCFGGRVRRHLDAGHHHRGTPIQHRARKAEFEPVRLASGIRLQFDLEPRRRGFARRVAAQVFGDEFGVVGVDEVGEPAAEQLAGIRHAREFREARVRELDAVALDQHRFVHRFEQPPVDALALFACRALDLQSLDQAVDAAGDLAGAALARMRREALGQVAAVGDGLQALAELAQALDFARTLQQRHGQHDRHGSQQDQREHHGVILRTGHVPVGPRAAAFLQGFVVVFVHAPGLRQQHIGTYRAHPPDSP